VIGEQLEGERSIKRPISIHIRLVGR